MAVREGILESVVSWCGNVTLGVRGWFRGRGGHVMIREVEATGTSQKGGEC